MRRNLSKKPLGFWKKRETDNETTEQGGGPDGEEAEDNDIM
jgi:hypothetical protein